jgi:hypothetical protein
MSGSSAKLEGMETEKCQASDGKGKQEHQQHCHKSPFAKGIFSGGHTEEGNQNALDRVALWRAEWPGAPQASGSLIGTGPDR